MSLLRWIQLALWLSVLLLVPPQGAQRESNSPWLRYQTGRATWYGTGRWARRFPAAIYKGIAVKLGEGPYQLAHNELPLLTPVRVTNVKTGVSVVALVTDRGVFAPNVIADLNHPLFVALADPSTGVVRVLIDTLTH